MNVTKADIVEKIASGTGLTKIETETVINAFIHVIGDTLRNGDEIEIRGLGSFRIIKRNPRIAHNPKTGKKVLVPERRSLVFKAAKELKRCAMESILTTMTDNQS